MVNFHCHSCVGTLSLLHVHEIWPLSILLPTVWVVFSSFMFMKPVNCTSRLILTPFITLEPLYERPLGMRYIIYFPWLAALSFPLAEPFL